MKKIMIILLFGILLAGGVIAERYEDNFFKQGEIDINGNSIETNTPINDVNVLGFVCSSNDCSTISTTLWGGKTLQSTDDFIQLVYPTKLLSDFGYGVYMFKDGYIPYEVNAGWWGTNPEDPTGPYDNYLAKKEIGVSEITNLKVGLDGDVASVSFSVESAIEHGGPLDYVPSKLEGHYSVEVEVKLKVEKDGVSYYGDVKNVVVAFSGIEDVDFSFDVEVGEYDLVVSTFVVDDKCIDSLEKTKSAKLSVPEVIDDDQDDDGIIDDEDNCVFVWNPGQGDEDDDGVGDACDDVNDLDLDDDGVLNDDDNCVLISNADQEDTDGDGVGDVCDSQDDTDTDEDGVIDLEDNCVLIPNPFQEDGDGDGIGDVCDDGPVVCDLALGDLSGSGLVTALDYAILRAYLLGGSLDDCQLIAADVNCDGVIDDTDLHLIRYAVLHPDFSLYCGVSDTDEDGILDEGDNCPLIANPGQEDSDGDGIGDVCDEPIEEPDTTAPEIVVVSPVVGEEYEEGVLISFTATDAGGVVRMWYVVGGESFEYTFPVEIEMDEGDYVIVLYAEDGEGNVASKSISFSIFVDDDDDDEKNDDDRSNLDNIYLEFRELFSEAKPIVLTSGGNSGIEIIELGGNLGSSTGTGGYEFDVVFWVGLLVVLIVLLLIIIVVVLVL